MVVKREIYNNFGSLISRKAVEKVQRRRKILIKHVKVNLQQLKQQDIHRGK
jgi:hypothetical protein